MFNPNQVSIETPVYQNNDETEHVPWNLVGIVRINGQKPIKNDQ